MAKKLNGYVVAALLFLGALFPLGALAQGGPGGGAVGGGPGPVPNPWIVNGATISYNNGGATLPQSVTGGGQGVGTINVSGGYYVNGVNILGSPCVTCAVKNATNTFTANQIISVNGGTTPTAQANMLLQVVGANASNGRIEIDTFGGAGFISGVRSNGTPASPTTLANNDEIISVNAWGYNGTARNGPAAAMRLYAGGSWTNTSQPTYIDFATTASASTTLTSRMQIAANGGVTIGSVSSNGAGTLNIQSGLQVAGSFTATGLVGLSNLANQAGNTVLANGTGSSAAPTAFAMPSCSTSASALQWLTNTGFQCGTISASAASITVGTTTVLSGTTTRVLYNNAGVLGEYTITGSGTVVAMQTSPNFQTTVTITSSNAAALAVGLNGSTNPAFNVDASTASSATGVNVKSAAAGAGVAVSAISSGTNEALTVNAKGSGLISIGNISTGGLALAGGGGGVAIGGCIIGANSLCTSGSASFAGVFSSAHIITSTSATALTAGPNGTTNPSFNVDASTASAATGLNVKSAAAAGGLAVSVISSGTNESLTIDAKGSGTVTINGTATGAISLSRTTTVTSSAASALAVGPSGATNPVFAVDASTASQVAGLKLTGAATAGTVALVATDSGTAASLSINAKGSGQVTVGDASTGGVGLGAGGGGVRIGSAITYGGVTLNNAVTGTGNMVLSASPTFSGTIGGSAILPIAGLSGLGTNVATALGTATGSVNGFPRIIATGTIALGTGAVVSGACSSASTAVATGTLTTDVIDVSFNGDPTGTTGYGPTAMLTLVIYPTADTVNVKQCNLTGGSITPSALTLNWRVRR